MAAEEIRNLIIIGSGAASDTATIYGRRPQLASSLLKVVTESLLETQGGTGTGGCAMDTGSVDGPLLTDGDDEGGVKLGEQAHRRQCAALLFELIGGYVEGDADRVAQVAGQVDASGRVGEVLAEATRFTSYLTAEARAAGARLRAERIRAGVLSRLAPTVPPHHELAVSAALDALFEGRFRAAAAAFGDGSAGDLIALHALAAFTAMLGAHAFAPGEFTSANLVALASVMRPRD
ncbi:hypothetical protein [Amycolatopsis sp. FDAARGOS 1241]|uniref:hypothetical protein n=1 Tax=Amycolatopsis sp. FDAARGOS 1241 TaxID=2778070 RepID=UPI00195271DE|nr:hypothetical protein [Amycolatopsis sp. FDAARGOS 1241]QRP42691.1 hypothetical protein I6J71_24660 [Amycolatopsis sp. FDAARGOS 1241]